jgi:hypothetical protein
MITVIEKIQQINLRPESHLHGRQTDVSKQGTVGVYRIQIPTVSCKFFVKITMLLDLYGIQYLFMKRA